MTIQIMQNRRWEKAISALLIAALCFWRIPFLNKGIDYTDTGFSMANYRNVFYGNGIHGIGLFYTNLLGGIIYRILPAYHLLVFRTIHWLLNLGTYFFTYRIFKRYLNLNIILLLLLAISFGVKKGEALFSYYPLTSLFLVLSLLLLIEGLTSSDIKKVFLSGFVAELNIFVRLPNALFLSMVVFTLLYGKWENKGHRISFKNIWSYMLGTLASLFVSGSVIVIFLGPQAVFQSFRGYIRLALGRVDSQVENVIGIQEKSGHSFLAEFKMMAYQGLICVETTLLYVLPILMICALFFWGVKKALWNHEDESRKSSNYLPGIITLIVAVILIFFVRNALFSAIAMIFYLFSMLLCLIIFTVVEKNDSEGKLLIGLIFLMGCCSVFGSDLGFARLGIINGLLALSVAFCLQRVYLQMPQKNYGKVQKRVFEFFTSFGIIVVVAMYVVGIFSYFPYTYMDGSYKELMCSVSEEIKPLKGMKTSKVRAEEINEFYQLMNSDELKGKEVAIFGYFPLGFVISGHHNYFEDVQPCVDYFSVSVEDLLRIINEKEKERVFPVIVVSYVNQLQLGDDHFTSDAKMAVIDYMLGLHQYEVYSSDDYFTIYVPYNSPNTD